MTPIEQETAGSATARRPHWVVVALVAALLLAGAGVSYLGIRDQPLPNTEPAPTAVPSGDRVVHIDLPHENFPVPPGPHREQFQVNCTVCHSPRLAFTQPPLAEKQWQAVVHKMVAVYGAPLGAEDEREIVTYLTAVHSQTP